MFECPSRNAHEYAAEWVRYEEAEDELVARASVLLERVKRVTSGTLSCSTGAPSASAAGWKSAFMEDEEEMGLHKDASETCTKSKRWGKEPGFRAALDVIWATRVGLLSAATGLDWKAVLDRGGVFMHWSLYAHGSRTQGSRAGKTRFLRTHDLIRARATSPLKIPSHQLPLSPQEDCL